MITPRATRLVRVPDLEAMRSAIAWLAPAGDIGVRRTAVLVPTRGAAAELRRSLETLALAGGAAVVVLPEILTRAELYGRLHGALPGAPPMLTEPEREVLLRRAARSAAAAGAAPPFRLRPGLVVQMLDFYDELRRREQSLDDFERLVLGQLTPAVDIDRGAERLARQTTFLCAAFSAFERLIGDSGRLDEHALRALLLGARSGLRPVHRRVIVTTADRAADPRGLYAGDFDLLTRIPGVDRIDVIATENLLASGFHERIHQLLPGLEEERFSGAAELPALVAPEAAEPSQRWFVCRDREEELVELVRWLKQRAVSPHEAVRPPVLDRFAVVYQRPLPYLYLAQQVLGSGRVPYQALDALPLSAEPMAAAVDVVLSFLASEGNRASAIELLHSPQFVFSERLTRRDVLALDTELKDRQYAGGWERLERMSLPEGTPGASAARALECLREAAGALRPAVTAGTASAQFGALLDVLRRFERVPLAPAAGAPAWPARHLRARAAVLAALEALRDAHARHDDEPIDVVELGGSVRRWLEAQTFSPRTGTQGLRLLDAASAPYADVDEVRLVGLVERDWPERAGRSIFYPASILSLLGWPADASRVAAARARFHDLLALAGRRVSLSSFTLEDDAIVSGSPLLEEVEAAGLPLERWPSPAPALAFEHELVEAGAAAGDAAVSAWLALRSARPAGEDGRFRGSTGPRAPRSYGISYLERYLDCPFKYFASQVLKLPEERDEESGLTPIERGHFVHGVFETFFQSWQAAGHGTITIENVADALTMFEAVADRRLETLPEADRALERTHLLGSAAASGLAERAFAFEIEQGGAVVERLLEHVLEGPFVFAGPDGARTVQVRAKADRIDLMADGTLRIIDYKLSRAPKQARALQLPIYGVIARQALDGRHGRSWTVASAGYVAFREREPFVPLGGRGSALEPAIADGQQRMLGAIDAIERGEFPVQPDEPYRCQWCGYAAVCRKDYVGDE